MHEAFNRLLLEHGQELLQRKMRLERVRDIVSTDAVRTKTWKTTERFRHKIDFFGLCVNSI